MIKKLLLFWGVLMITKLLIAGPLPPLFEEKYKKQILSVEGGTLSALRLLAKKADIENSFNVINLSKVQECYLLWKELLPTMTPYYAIKTNPNPLIVELLHHLGTGFDAASRYEIEEALKAGADAKKIIFAHPRKTQEDILFAKKNNITKMTFDSMDELKKMSEFYPEGEYVLRLKVHDSHSLSPLGHKFGASFEEAMALLSYAKEHHLKIVGISFHVGSGCDDAGAYVKALDEVATVFEVAKKKFQFSFSLLDIGGGWPGHNDVLFKKMAQSVTQLLQSKFPKDLIVIAEPGRFFAEPAVAIATRVIGVSEHIKDNKKEYAYYLSDGVYGSFLTSLYHQFKTDLIEAEGLKLRPLTLTEEEFGKLKENQKFMTTLWGPTCDSSDKIFENILFPKVERGDFLYTENAGAYTLATKTAFNGIPVSKSYYIQE